jgi:hypothetical protein
MVACSVIRDIECLFCGVFYAWKRSRWFGELSHLVHDLLTLIIGNRGNLLVHSD